MVSGFLGSASQSNSYSYQTTVNNTDSNNRSAANNSVLDNVGNLTVQFGGQENAFDRWLPLVFLGFLLLAFAKGK